MGIMKDHALVVKVTGLTQRQAGQLTSNLVTTKARHAPECRITVVSGESARLKGTVTSGQKRIRG